MDKQKVVGIVMFIGAALFMGAAVHPAIQKHWSTAYLLVPIDYKSGWLFGYRMFALGALFTAIGFALLGSQLRQRSATKFTQTSSLVADAFIMIGAVSWARSLNRNVFPPIHLLLLEEISIPWVSMFAYLTLLSFLIYGYLLIRLDYPKWLSWGTLGFNGLLLIVLSLLGDLPPAVFYLWPLILGLGLVSNRRE
jgi:hypothetical protein